eukprot:10910445-Ditylum_brightwellii.AAC.1
MGADATKSQALGFEVTVWLVCVGLEDAVVNVVMFDRDAKLIGKAFEGMLGIQYIIYVEGDLILVIEVCTGMISKNSAATVLGSFLLFSKCVWELTTMPRLILVDGDFGPRGNITELENSFRARIIYS